MKCFQKNEERAEGEGLLLHRLRVRDSSSDFPAVTGFHFANRLQLPALYGGQNRR